MILMAVNNTPHNTKNYRVKENGQETATKGNV